MRYGDWIVLLSMTLNGSAAMLYGYQGHWWNAGYWLSALSLNFFLLKL